MRICVILSGSIAAFKACDLISKLVKAGHEVQPMATEGALRFVGEISLEALSGRPLMKDIWQRRESMEHIAIRRWADLFIFYPATANRINQLAAGIAGDLVGATFLANNFEKPFWIAPAMNTNMLRHPATQASLRTLESWGCTIYSGDSGRLACGDVGEGRLVEPTAILDEVQSWVERRNGFAANVGATASPAGATSQPGPEAATNDLSTHPKRLLITGGAMTEKIDAVRSIVNTSSGRSAAAISAHFLSQGWEVRWLHHESASTDLAIPQSVDPEQNPGDSQLERLQLFSYRSFEDLQALLEESLAESWDLVIHAAAVSDWTLDPAKAPKGKLHTGERLVLEFIPRPKLLAYIQSRACTAEGKPAPIVGFKLTVAEDESAAQQRIARLESADAVVWNDLTTIAIPQDASGERAHLFAIYDQTNPGKAVAQGTTDTQLANALANWYLQRISK